MTSRGEYSGQGNSIKEERNDGHLWKSSYSGDAGVWGVMKEAVMSSHSGQWAALCHSATWTTTCWSSGGWLLEGLTWRFYSHLSLWHLWLPYGPRWGALYITKVHSSWAPSNSCILFIPHILFSSLLMKSPMPQPSPSRCQAVQWIKCCLTKTQQLGMSLTVYIMNSYSTLCSSHHLSVNNIPIIGLWPIFPDQYFSMDIAIFERLK